MDVRVRDGIVYADRIQTWQRSPRVHDAGRICKTPGCTTVLSVYNGSSRCSLHSTPVLGGTHRVHRAGRSGTAQRRVAA